MLIDRIGIFIWSITRGKTIVRADDKSAHGPTNNEKVLETALFPCYKLKQMKKKPNLLTKK